MYKRLFVFIIDQWNLECFVFFCLLLLYFVFSSLYSLSTTIHLPIFFDYYCYNSSVYFDSSANDSDCARICKDHSSDSSDYAD